jgi:hypothetical protein
MVQSETDLFLQRRGNVPVASPNMARAVSPYRREMLAQQVERGLYREQGVDARGNPVSRQDGFQENIKTAAGNVLSSKRFKIASSNAPGAGDGVGLGSYRGGGGTLRQVPEIYSPLWLNSNLNLPRDRATINAWSRAFFALNPVVQNAVSLHSTYPISKLNIKCKNPKVQRFFEDMIEEIDLMNICVQIAQEYWLLGEAFVYAELDERSASWSRLLIQNPDYMVVKHSVVAGEPILSLRPDENLKKIVNSNRPSDIQQRHRLDPSIIEHVKRGENIPLSNFYASHIARRISPYETRGTGLVTSCFRQLMLFDKLRESKFAQADNMVNPLTLVKIGGGGENYKPTPADLEGWRQVFEECHDEETEVLTDRGFMKFDEAIEISNLLEGSTGGVSKSFSKPKSGIKIACFNPDTEQLEYHEPSESHVYDYDGDMYHFHNDKMDIKVTPNHKMWVQKKKFKGTGKQRSWHWGKWDKVRAKDMKFFDRRFRSKISWEGNSSKKYVNVAGKDVPIKLYLEYLGYLISEGCLYTDGKSQHTVGITQTITRKYGQDNSHKYKKMSECMKSLAKHLDKSYSDRIIDRENNGTVWDGIFCGWELFKHFVQEINTNGKYKSKNKKIPRWVLGLDSDLLKVLLDALMLGDGGTQGENGKFYYTSSKELANNVYELVYKAGYVPTMLVKNSDQYTIQWSETNIGEYPLINKYSVDPRTKTKKEIVSKVPYQGKVWCFTVPTGLFVTRRNGKITIQGNSQYDKDFKIFCHDAVTVERVGWNAGIIDISNDITQLLKETYIGLMVPQVLMDGGGDVTYANGGVTLDVLRQRYLQFRNMLASWLRRKIFAPISKINEFYEKKDGEYVLVVPEVEWNHMSLFDAGDYIQVLMSLAQGETPKVSDQTLYRSLGLDYEDEVRKMREESIQRAINAKEGAALEAMSLTELRTLGPEDVIEEPEDDLEAGGGAALPGEDTGGGGLDLPDLGGPPPAPGGDLGGGGGEAPPPPPPPPGEGG